MNQNNLDHLVDLMSTHWHSTLHNVPSEALKASWRQSFVTYNRKIAEHDMPGYEADWHVLSPKTGTGKSESLKLYAAEVSRNDYTAPGILIVVRLISQAEEFVNDINTRAGEQVAVARHHQSNEVPLERLSDYPVLVITHAAFTGHVRRSDAWASYMKWADGRRKLVVIDEAIDVLDIARIDSDVVDKLAGAVPSQARSQWPEGYAAIETLRAILADIRARPKDQTAESRVLLSGSRRRYLEMFEGGFNGLEQLQQIRNYMRSDEHRYLLGKRTVDIEAEARQKRIFDKIFSDLIAIYDSFILHYKQGNTHTLNTATRILPDDAQGCVVLDATADTNPIYECMEREEHNVLKHTAISCRTYQNVTLRPSFGHAVGRSSLTRVRKGQKEPGAKTEAPKLMQALTDEHSRRADTDCPMEKVLVVCHKDAKPYLAGFEVPFQYDLAHYGALDGLNVWSDFDSVVIFGLDYRHPADAPTQFMALQPDSQNDDWLHNKAKRAFRGYSDIRAAIDVGVIASSVIQAVNRIQTRRVIDAEGNCPASFVYLLLPDGHLGKSVHDILLDQMPDMRVEPWVFDGAKRAPRSKHEASLGEFIKGLSAGESFSATQVRQHLSIPRATWDRLAKKMASETTGLSQLMAANAVRYEVAREGSRQVGRLVRL